MTTDDPIILSTMAFAPSEHIVFRSRVMARTIQIRDDLHMTSVLLNNKDAHKLYLFLKTVFGE